MKLFRTIYEVTDLVMLNTGIKKIDVSSKRKMLTDEQEEEMYGKSFMRLYNQLPDIVTDTYRYAVTYILHTYKETLTTTTSYFRIFKKYESKERYKLELTMYGEPISVTFTPSSALDKPVYVENSPENRSVRLFKSKDENLYSEVYKTLNLDPSDANFKDIHKSLSVTVKEIPLNWSRIRYRFSNQHYIRVEDKDRSRMILELMLETGRKDLQGELRRNMYSGKLLSLLTDGEVNKNCLLAKKTEESVLPFL